MSNFTANFRLFHRKRAAAGLQPAATFRKEELALIESLERQRHRTGRVRAVIDDPQGKYAPVLESYLAYIQRFDKRDALIVTPRRQNFRPSPELQRSRVHKITARSYLKLLGAPRCIGQILLLNAHAYCPSLPLSRSRLDQILQIVIPYANGPNSLLIIHGSTRTPRRTRFHHWVEQAISLRHTPAPLYMLYSGAESSAHIVAAGLQPAAPLPRVSDPHCAQLILLPSHPALPPRRAPLKIAA